MRTAHTLHLNLKVYVARSGSVCGLATHAVDRGAGYGLLRRAADFKGNQISRHAVFTKLTAALAVLVGKFAVDDGGGDNLHGGLLYFRVERYRDFSGKRPSENGVLVFRRPFLKILVWLMNALS